MQRNQKTKIYIYWGKQVGLEDERDDFIFESDAGMGRTYKLRRVTDDPVEVKAEYLGSIVFPRPKDSNPHILFEELFVGELQRYIRKYARKVLLNTNDLLDNLEVIEKHVQLTFDDEDKESKIKTLSLISSFIKRYTLIKG